MEATSPIIDRYHAFQPLEDMIQRMKTKAEEPKKPFLKDVPREIVSQGHNNTRARFGR